MTKTFITNSEKETYDVAKEFAKTLTPGQIVCMYGDIGAGKTVFAKGVCASLGVTEHISSPTFTIVNEYEGNAFTIYHFDLYRIAEPDELYEIGFHEMLDSGGVSIIEWPQMAGELMPQKHTKVYVERLEEDSRKITIEE